MLSVYDSVRTVACIRLTAISKYSQCKHNVKQKFISPFHSLTFLLSYFCLFRRWYLVYFSFFLVLFTIGFFFLVHLCFVHWFLDKTQNQKLDENKISFSCYTSWPTYCISWSMFLSLSLSVQYFSLYFWLFVVVCDIWLPSMMNILIFFRISINLCTHKIRI